MRTRTMATRLGVAVVVVVVVAIGLLASGALRSLTGNNQSLAAVSNSGLDVAQGFNFKTTGQTGVGYLTSLTLGGVTYAPDLTVTVPTSPPTTKAVVGVLSAETWNGGVADPIQLKAQISTANKQKVALYQHSASNLSAQFTFVIYSYDQVVKQYFVSLTGNGTTSLQAQVVKVGTTVEVTLDTTPGTVVQSPQNWGVAIAFAPIGPQSLTYRVSSTQALAKAWGQ